MENKIQNRLEEIAKTSANRIELEKNVYELYKEVMTTDSRLLSVRITWEGQATWTISLLANPYHFGRELAEELEAIKVTTHNEDRVKADDEDDYEPYTVADLGDDIYDTMFNHAYSIM